MKLLVLKYMGLVLLLYFSLKALKFIDVSANYEEPEPRIVYKPIPAETIYVAPVPYKVHKEEYFRKLNWIYPPGNQRLNILPLSGLEREWQQNQKRKVYKPTYDYDGNPDPELMEEFQEGP